MILYTGDAEGSTEFVVASVALADTSRAIVYAIGDAESSQLMTKTAHNRSEVCVR